ncbi:MAG: NADP-dependent oxidoreductase [Pirellulales bacterium]
MPPINRQIQLAARPKGFPHETDFQLVAAPVPQPTEGQFLVESIYLSVDPYMRGRMNDVASYADPVDIGQVMVGECVGRVIESRHARFPKGSYVCGMFGWQEYAVSDGAGVRKLDPSLAPLSTAVHVLGMPGLTAYFGLMEVCRPQPGQTVVISAAAGAVGSAVGQLAKLAGCRVVGIAGSQEKIDWIIGELGFDAALNYKTSDNYCEDLKQLCPEGIDAYFDNVGGPITDAVFPLLSVGARIAICGQISQYNVDKPQQGPRLLWHLIIKRATVQGFLVFDFADQYRAALRQLGEWFQAGKLRYRERITDGIENAPRAFLELMQGANVGKQLVRLRDEPTTTLRFTSP